MDAIGRTWLALGIALGALMLVAGTPSLAAMDGVSFKGKTVTLLIGSTPGGSTDLSGRLIHPYIAKYLPGSPRSVVQNKPGARGMTAMNYFAQAAKPDGLTVIWGSNQQVDPNVYRQPQSRYNPTEFRMVGGIDVGGSFMFVRNEVLGRLKDKSAEPVPMASTSGSPRSGMLMAAWGAEFLGWNIKWVAGYRGSSSLLLALKRGEAGMTSLSLSTTGIDEVVTDKSAFTIVSQTGTHGGAKPTTVSLLRDVPLFPEMMKGKISDPVAQEAFAYWRNISSIIKWYGLPPGTPDNVLAAYKAALQKTLNDPAFLKSGKKLAADFSVLTGEDLTATVQALAKTGDEALAYMPKLLNKQGYEIATQKKKKK
ncbi:MAG TPA: hypothetical protein VLS27_13075 [Gammaproteobacteria bacterium]|nr:hypothetical protein [Gammaproteobacteria bacterium]